MNTKTASTSTEQRYTKQFVFVFICALLPYLLISQYIFPSGDDYSYAWKGAVSTDFTATLIGEWNNWNGRYFSNILVLINPISTENFALYQLASLALIALFLTFNFALVKTRLPVTFSQTFFLVLSFTLIYFSTLPDVGEGLYWYTGAVTYLFPVALFPVHLILVTQSLSCRVSHPVSSVKKQVVISFLVVLLQGILTGCNEIMLVLLLLIHLGLFFTQKQVPLAPKILLLLTQIGFSCLVIFAPGNEIRSSFFTDQHNVMHTFFNGSANTLRFSFQLLANPILWISLLLIKKLLSSSQLFKTSFSNWTWLILFITPQFIACAAPVWSTGMIGQHRTPNFALYFQLLVVFAFFLSHTQHFIVKKTTALAQNMHLKTLTICMVIALFFYGNNGSVIKDLLSGDAACFKSENLKRIEALKNLSNVNDSTVFFPNYSCQPASIFIYDITSNPKDWQNEVYTLYFNVKQNGVQIYSKP